MPNRNFKLTLALVEGRIYAGENMRMRCEALGAAAGKVAILGSNEKVLSASNSKTKVLNLRGRALIPGFIDAHTHFIQMGVSTLHLDLSKTGSLRRLLTQVQRITRTKRNGEWILGSSWDESKWPEKRYPTVDDLDQVAKKNPVWLRRVDGHMGVANSLALKKTDIPTSIRGFEVDPTGAPTGILREEAMESMEARVQPDEKTMLQGLRKATATAHRLGVTSIHDMAEPAHIQIYRRLAKRGQLRIRVYLNFFADSLSRIIRSGMQTGEGNERLRLGALKLFADGSLGAHTAALWEPYTDIPDETGMLVHSPDRLTKLVTQADRHSIQVAIHCIGEKGIDTALGAFEVGAHPQSLLSRRHRLEHFELVDSEFVDRSKKLHLVLSMQPNYVDLWSRPRGMYEARLGKERLQKNNPFRKLLNASLPVAFGSDCMPFSPLYGIYSAVNAPLESQRLSVTEAISCYTAGGAYASFEEVSKGTIEVDKLADVVALSSDPFEEPQVLHRIKVDLTVLDGEIVYVRRGAIDLIGQLES